MPLKMCGIGKEYVNGEMNIPNGKYRLVEAIIVIGDKGIESISKGTFFKIEGIKNE